MQSGEKNSGWRLRTCHTVQTTPAANRACGVISGEFPPSSIFSRFRTECIIRPLVISAVKITQRWRRSPDWISAHMSLARLTQLPLRTELIIIEISVLASSLFPAVERTHFTRKKVFRNYTRPPNLAQWSEESRVSVLALGMYLSLWGNCRRDSVSSDMIITTYGGSRNHYHGSPFSA